MRYFLITAFLFISCASVHEAAAATKYAWPMDGPPALTSTFCEFRPGHFHSGIDLKVWGKVGLPCRAIESGYVSRVKVSPTGYGMALYLTLDNGVTAVYAHLQRFTTEIDNYISEAQHSNLTYAQDLFFSKDQGFTFQRGDIVAYSGRSGVKHPHLHFELRDEKERPLNPLLYGFEIEDHKKPSPRAIAVTPLNGKSTVEGDCLPRVFSNVLKENDGIFRLRDPVGISGEIGISVKTIDKMDGAENVLAVYRIELLIDDELVFTTSFDRFSFSDWRKIELERDYRLKKHGFGNYHRLFRVKGNDLDIISGEGIISLNEKKELDLMIKIYDRAENLSEINIQLVSDKLEDDSRSILGEPLIREVFGQGHTGNSLRYDLFPGFIRFVGPPGIESIKIDGKYDHRCTIHPINGGVATIWIPPEQFDGNMSVETFNLNNYLISTSHFKVFPAFTDKNNKILNEDKNVQLLIPESSLYESTLISITSEPEFEIPEFIESVYRVEPRDQALRGKVEIGLRADEKSIEGGWGLYYYDKKRGWTFLGNSLKDGYIYGSALSWEIFGLLKDTDKPVVNILNIKNGSTLKSTRPRFIVHVSDKTSDIVQDGLEMRIDGKKVPAGYDPPVDRFIYQTWKNLQFSEHTLEVLAKDQAGNLTRQEIKFKVIQ